MSTLCNTWALQVAIKTSGWKSKTVSKNHHKINMLTRGWNPSYFEICSKCEPSQ